MRPARRARFGGGRRRLRCVGSQQSLSQDCLEELKLLVLGVAANYSGVLRGPAKAPRLSAGPPPSVAQWLWYSALPYCRATRLDGERTHAQVLGERASTRDRGNSRPSVPHHGPNHRRGASAGLQLPVEAHEMSASGGANLPNAVFVNIFRATAATARRVVARGGRVGHCASLRGSFSRAMLSGSRYRVRRRARRSGTVPATQSI